MLHLNILNSVPDSQPQQRAAIAQGLSDLFSSSQSLQTSSEPRTRVRFSDHDRMLYSTDASLYQVEPIGVVVPASIADAVRAAQWCIDRRVPILPRGGGTSLAGQCTNAAVVLDLSAHCRKLVRLDAAARTCVVEPGMVIDELNAQLIQRSANLFFAPDPATARQCAVGGALGNNAAGARSIMYGRTSENLRAIEALLGTGERLWLRKDAGALDPRAAKLADGVMQIVRSNARLIRERFPRTVRRNAGYALDMILDQIEAGATPESLDLSKLLCGSEGTLALTLHAELDLHPLPQSKGMALLAFSSVEDAIDAVIPILQTKPCAVELLDDVVLGAARGNAQCREYLKVMPTINGQEPAAILYVEYFGFGSDDLPARFAALRHTLGSSFAPSRLIELCDQPTMNKAWALRKAGEPLLHGLATATGRSPITFVEDNAVPVEHLSQFVREFKKIVSKHGTTAAFWAHASVGVLHVRPLINLHDHSDRERMRSIALEVADLARACHGIMSGEHGDGRVRGPLLPRFFGPELMRAFQDIKRLFDPNNLLNPGNIVASGPLESITDHLRVDLGSPATESSHASPAEEVDTYFNYDAERGFGHAVEQCNGAGVCRKRGGVMCPSYQGTLDERHSTRGRGNALRLAITGQFPGNSISSSKPNFTDPATIETLDLCLSCKACKSECPSNVDIAKLKAEYTAQRYKQLGRVPLKALATGYIRSLNRMGSITPSLANFAGKSSFARAIINRVMHMHPQRSLPKFSTSLYALNRRRSSTKPAPDSPKLVLFTDCFTTYNESSIGLSALNVLEHLGYTTQLSGSHCCGRSMISVGMLPQAIESIDAAVESLRPAIEDDQIKAIIVCEPSCLSAIKDDWLTLKCSSSLELRTRLAEKAMLPEDFIERYWNTHPKPLAIQAAKQPVLLHTHCHQKAILGAESSIKLLRRVLDDRLKVIDSGCCGMAGSFGFDASKFDLSITLSEMSLIPSIRSAPQDAIILATGTSCRHQIHDRLGSTHAPALHPIEYLDRMLLSPHTH